MRTDRKILSKGPYTYSQPVGFLTVKQYIFAAVDGKKCLVLRFSNDADYKMDTVELTLTQMDAYGNVLTTTPVHLGIFLAAGKTAAIDRGIRVEEKCVDFRVRVESVRSGDYVYHERGGRIVVDYEVEPVWQIDPADQHAYERQKFRSLDVRSKLGKVPKLLGLITVLCALALLIISIRGFFPESETHEPIVGAYVTDATYDMGSNV